MNKQHGGARPGTGRPALRTKKQQHNVTLTPRCWAYLELSQIQRNDRNINLTIERIIRSQPDFGQLAPTGEDDMATQGDRARAWVGGALKRIQETGEPQVSKDWGGSDARRWVSVDRFEDGVYSATLCAWGFEAREISGSWRDVYDELVECLMGAG